MIERNIEGIHNSDVLNAIYLLNQEMPVTIDRLVAYLMVEIKYTEVIAGMVRHLAKIGVIFEVDGMLYVNPLWVRKVALRGE
jgi:hypothetical protein